MGRDNAKITAIVGSYRKGGMVDSAVDAMLESASNEGASTAKVYLIDKDIRFCTNCRTCNQIPGAARGRCPISDDMDELLDLIAGSDAIILASPMNFGAATAVTKRFIERLTSFAYWPWGVNAPKMRSTARGKRAVLVASSAAPALVARLASPLVKQLKQAAEVLGAHPAGVLFMGLAAREERQGLSARVRKKAQMLGKRLAIAQRE